MTVPISNEIIPLSIDNELEGESPNSKLKDDRLKHPKNVVISYLNINSVRNKLDLLEPLVSGLVDVLSIAEIKLDGSFPSSQFTLNGFKNPYRLDVSDTSRGLL